MKMGERFIARFLNCGTIDIWGQITLYDGLLSCTWEDVWQPLSALPTRHQRALPPPSKL